MIEVAAMPQPVMTLRATLARFGVASMSSAAVSLSHLLVQIVSVRRLEVAEIGTLAFLLVIIQFGYSLSNALISTPYTISVNQYEDEDASFYFRINLLLALSQALLCAAVAWLMASPAAAAAFGAAGLFSLIRWFGRANAYAHHTPHRAALSDVLYALIVVAGVGATLTVGARLELFGLVLAVSGIVAILPFGLRYVADHRPTALGQAFSAYRPVWKRQSAWTLVGVISAEGTSNSHSYIVTLLAGPAAFAPIAVGMLFFRPVNVCITALTQLERPRIARTIAKGDQAAARGLVHSFLAALVVIWAGTAGLAALVLWAFPHILIKPTLSLNTVAVAVAFCALLTLVQCLQTPIGVLTQSRGAFRPLAANSVRSCIISIFAVTLLAVAGLPIYTIAGVVFGQLVMMLGIYRLDRQWRPARVGAA